MTPENEQDARHILPIVEPVDHKRRFRSGCDKTFGNRLFDLSD